MNRRSRTLFRLSEAQNHRCAYCQSETYLTFSDECIVPPNMEPWQKATREHVVASSKGGKDGIYNLVMACARWNSMRSNCDAMEFYNMLREPYNNDYVSLHTQISDMKIITRINNRLM